jgi:hypothetical protein
LKTRAQLCLLPIPTATPTPLYRYSLEAQHESLEERPAKSHVFPLVSRRGAVVGIRQAFVVKFPELLDDVRAFQPLRWLDLKEFPLDKFEHVEQEGTTLLILPQGLDVLISAKWD